MIAKRIMSHIGTMLEVDKFSLSGSSMRFVRIRVSVQIVKSTSPWGLDSF